MNFTYPAEGPALDGSPVQILGQASANPIDQFDHYIIEYGLSHDPGGWGLLFGPSPNPVAEAGKLADWDLSTLPDGPITLRLIVFSKSGGTAERWIRLTIQRPTTTPTPSETAVPPTATFTPTLTPVSTATPTLTGVPTSTPTLTPVPSDTLPAPTDTPTATAPAPTATETATTGP
jgi:hypothetical protein